MVKLRARVRAALPWFLTIGIIAAAIPTDTYGEIATWLGLKRKINSEYGRIIFTGQAPPGLELELLAEWSFVNDPKDDGCGKWWQRIGIAIFENWPGTRLKRQGIWASPGPDGIYRLEAVIASPTEDDSCYWYLKGPKLYVGTKGRTNLSLLAEPSPHKGEDLVAELVVTPEGDARNETSLEYYAPKLEGQTQVVRIDMKQVPYSGSEP